MAVLGHVHVHVLRVSVHSRVPSSTLIGDEEPEEGVEFVGDRHDEPEEGVVVRDRVPPGVRSSR